MPKILELKKELKINKNKKQAKILASFFKTGKGEYGEGSIFLGIKVPLLRKIANKYLELDFKDLQNLLNNKIHTYKFIALIILVNKYKKGDDKLKKIIYNFYIKNLKNINNWDLVDISCYHIVGNFLLNKSKERIILYKLVKSRNLWFRRIAIVSTFIFIKNNKFKDTLKISKLLLNDKEDLINKAVGWMLREVGKRNQKLLEEFLKKNYQNMSRTTLRYAIERFEEKKRKYYLYK